MFSIPAASVVGEDRGDLVPGVARQVRWAIGVIEVSLATHVTRLRVRSRGRAPGAVGDRHEAGRQRFELGDRPAQRELGGVVLRGEELERERAPRGKEIDNTSHRPDATEGASGETGVSTLNLRSTYRDACLPRASRGSGDVSLRYTVTQLTGVRDFGAEVGRLRRTTGAPQRGGSGEGLWPSPS